MKAGVAVIAVMLIGVTACGSAEEPPTATAAATPGLSVQQVASTVAGLRAKNQKLVQDLEQYCDMSQWSDSLVEAQALACSYVVTRAPLEGQFAVKALTIANPPPEVATLIDALRKSAAELGEVSTKQCGESPTSDDCTMVETSKARGAAEDFQLAFAAWEPYTGGAS